MDAKKEIDALNIYPNKSSKIDVLTPHKITVVSIQINAKPFMNDSDFM